VETHSEYTGFLVVNKPVGITSHDVVDRIRQVLGMRKVGHLGTLDPLGTGVLVLAVGRATKSVKFFIDDDKDYRANILFGTITDTQDTDGKVLETRDYSGVTKEHIEEILKEFTGKITQIPPMVSAKKINGKRLYKLHRKGIEVPREPKEIEIYRLVIEDFALPSATIFLSCSKGTYVRTLCADIGEKLGCGGCMSSLVRVRSGCFSLNDSYKLDEVEKMTQEQAAKLILPIHDVYAKRGLK
jgi:tRNA pseudouridine55 synthase